jgi:hypothetical protein
MAAKPVAPEILPVSLLDDLSYSPVDDRKYRQMVDSALGISLDARERLAGIPGKKLGITDPMKRTVGFVIEKLSECVENEWRDVSSGYVRAFQFKLPSPWKYDYQNRFPNTCTAYIWRENNQVQHLVCAEGEWRPSRHAGKRFNGWAKSSIELSDILGQLKVWAESLLDETTIEDDLSGAFTSLQEYDKTGLLPPGSRSKPILVYEGAMHYSSYRDVNGKPIGLPLPRQLYVVKRAQVSVQFYAFGRTERVCVAYKNP